MATSRNTLAPEYPIELQVKNTFLHSPMGHHWYMEGVPALRRIASAPSLHQGCADNMFDDLEHSSAEVLLLASAHTPGTAGGGDMEASSVDECVDIDGQNLGSVDGASPRCGPPVLSPSSSTSASGGSLRSNSATPRDSLESEVSFSHGAQEVEQKHSPPILRLAEVLLALDVTESETAVPEMPSLGSRGHMSGQCRPCMFVWRKVGCHNGSACSFCHLCSPGGWYKQRKKVVKAENESSNFTTTRQSGHLAEFTSPEFQHIPGSVW